MRSKQISTGQVQKLRYAYTLQIELLTKNDERITDGNNIGGVMKQEQYANA
jgi:hypothetical protein